MTKGQVLEKVDEGEERGGYISWRALDCATFLSVWAKEPCDSGYSIWIYDCTPIC